MAAVAAALEQYLAPEAEPVEHPPASRRIWSRLARLFSARRRPRAPAAVAAEAPPEKMPVAAAPPPEAPQPTLGNDAEPSPGSCPFRLDSIQDTRPTEDPLVTQDSHITEDSRLTQESFRFDPPSLPAESASAVRSQETVEVTVAVTQE
jgi:hypothetical protein